jgi:sugar phosphate isomerase/epimerase
VGGVVPDIFLGTIVLEPNRWSTIRQDCRATTEISAWLDRVQGAGFDGIELWEPHVREASDAELAAILDNPLPVSVFNTYVGFDEADPSNREAAAEWVRRSGATRVKWNTGPERDDVSLAAYAERLAEWAALLPGVELICECHDGSAMDDPAVAAKILVAGSNALVHTHDDLDLLRRKFSAYGPRITHVHVNHLFTGSPKLEEISDELAEKIALVRELGFDGTWTIEFVHGTGGEHDEPAPMFAQAVEDLGVLRSLLG